MAMIAFGGGIGHADQNEERNDGPDDLRPWCCDGSLPLCNPRLAVLEHGIEHALKHAHENRQAYPQQHRMLVVYLPRNDRLRLGQINLVWIRRGRHSQSRMQRGHQTPHYG